MTIWHYRKLIKEGVKNLLLGATSAGDSVENGRRNGIDPKEMPFIAVYATDETVKRVADSPLEVERTLTVVVECYTAKRDGADGDFDTLSGEVETLLNDIDPGLILEGASSFNLLRVEQVNEGEKAAQAYSFGALTYEIVYNVVADSIVSPTIATVETISNLTPPS
jgi:hypothetical protein